MTVKPRLLLIVAIVGGLPALAALAGWTYEGPRRTTGLVVTVAVLALAGLLLLRLLTRLHRAETLAERLARGDLALDRRGDPGSGDLLDSLEALEGGVRGVLGGLGRSAESFSHLSDSLSSAAAEISAAAANQSEATEMGSVLVEKMGLSIATVAKGARAVGDEVSKASTSVEEMSASNDTVVRNTEKLAVDVTENLAMVHQLARSVEQVAASAMGAGEASETAVAQAREGGEVVGRAGEGVEQLARTMTEIAEVNRSLAGSSERINYVTEVIEEIAKKTKLLALNASLQATHAGEHGRAFRAVAVEVKALAERSAGSAKEIAALIEEVQKTIREAETISQLGADKARDSVRLASRAGGQLSQVVDTIQDVSDNMLGISDATREQAAGSERLVATFERMQRMTDEVAAATRQQRLGGQQILEAMERLRGIAESVADAVSEHGEDGRQVKKAMSSIAEISAQNLATAGAIVEVTEELERQTADLEALAGSFRAAPPAVDAADGGDAKPDGPDRATSGGLALLQSPERHPV